MVLVTACIPADARWLPGEPPCGSNDHYLHIMAFALGYLSLLISLTFKKQQERSEDLRAVHVEWFSVLDSRLRGAAFPKEL
jgi:hypothetical protein